MTDDDRTDEYLDTWGDQDGAELLDDVHDFLTRFVVYPSEHHAVAHTLWIAHAWWMDQWDSTPRIAFLSPEPGSGKSRALEVTEPLVPRPVHAVNTSSAYLFRKVSDPLGRPTILYDECDTLFGPKAKEHEEVRGMINAGHRKGAVAGRCVVRGKEVFTEELPAYCAVALAGLDDLPDTMMTRSVVVRMKRRAPTEPIDPWRRRINGPDAAKLYERLLGWSTEVVPDSWPDLPPSIEDRDADVWEALIAVADCAQGRWPDTARAAAVALVAESKTSRPSLGVLLLHDIRTVFLRSGRGKLPTIDILGALNDMDESPWGAIRRGEPMNARGLATRLGRYGIGPQVQRAGAEVFRGYTRAEFEDAWSRYLPPDDGCLLVSLGTVTPVTSATPSLYATGLPAPYQPRATDVTDVTGPRETSPHCDCGNTLLTPDAINSGKCKPCRNKLMAGYDQ